MTDQEPGIGLVLGGGGIAGYAFHCAILATLQDQTGFDPRTAEIVVGTSAGAIAAALLRGDVPATQMRDRLSAAIDDPDEMPMLKLLAGPTPKTVPRLWAGPGAPVMAVRELRRGRALRISKLVAALLPRGRSPLTAVGELLDLLHPDGWPARELWIPATDLRTGRVVVFGRPTEPRTPGGRVPEGEASVAQAAEASAALPVFFAPVQIGNRRYIDGGISSPFNADLLIDYLVPDRDDPAAQPRPLDLVIVLAPLSVDELTARTPFSSVARSLPRRRLHSEVQRISADGTATLVVQPDAAVAGAMGLNPMDPSRVPAIIEASAEMLRRQLLTTPAATVDLLERAGHSLSSPPNAAHPTF